jgi:hypothetical protein
MVLGTRALNKKYKTGFLLRRFFYILTSKYLIKRTRMKKLLLIIALGIIFLLNAKAQTPLPVNKSLIVKLTATWCGPCGTQGFPQSEELIANMNNDAFFIATYSSGYTSWHDSDFFCMAAQYWDQQLYWGGIPAFSCNFKDKSQFAQTNIDIDNGVYDEIDNFKAKPVIASTGYTLEKLGNTLNVVTRTKFWADASGDYYLVPCIVEDSVEHSQNGQTDTTHTVPHRFVLREVMTSTGWGDLIASGNITANQTFDKSFSFTVTNPTWNVNRLRVAVILFKKTGTIYTYANGNDLYDWATNVKDANALNNISLYPNPATNYTEIGFTTTKAVHVNIAVTDMLGHIVYTDNNVHFAAGENEYHFNLGGFAPGFYTATINSEAGSVSKYFSVVK